MTVLTIQIVVKDATLKRLNARESVHVPNARKVVSATIVNIRHVIERLPSAKGKNWPELRPRLLISLT